MEPVNFSEKTVLISGASGAIGSEIARRFAAQGAFLTLISSNAESLAEISRELAELGCSLTGIVCDLSSDVLTRDLLENQLNDAHFDVVINCAGVFPITPISEMSLETFTKVMNVNVGAAYQLCMKFAPAMAKSGWGRIVNIGSSSCYAGFRNTTAYCASKHALLGLSRALHDEVKASGVRVYHISPSSTKGRMGKATPGQDYETFLEASEVADYVMFAISHDGNAMSQEILINRMQVR